jgi:hypothetical protein
LIKADFPSKHHSRSPMGWYCFPHLRPVEP